MKSEQEEGFTVKIKVLRRLSGYRGDIPRKRSEEFSSRYYFQNTRLFIRFIKIFKILICPVRGVVGHIVVLVTFRSKQYMDVGEFKIGSGTRKKRESDVPIQPRNYFQYFVGLKKKCIFDPFYVYFCVFRVNMGPFECFSSKLGTFMVQKNIASAWNQILKISSQILFDLKTSNPVLNSLQYIYSNHDLIKTIYMFLRYN